MPCLITNYETSLNDNAPKKGTLFLCSQSAMILKRERDIITQQLEYFSRAHLLENNLLKKRAPSNK